jgi:hypothetical protein
MLASKHDQARSETSLGTVKSETHNGVANKHTHTSNDNQQRKKQGIKNQVSD